MARPPKNPDLVSGNHLSKEDKALRSKVEAMFGADLKADLEPSNRLNRNQKKIFKFIKEHIKNVGILGDIDVVMLESTCIAIDRLQQIEKLINEDFDNIFNRDLMSAKSKYTADLLKGVEFFGMSPTTRAKFGSLIANNKEKEQDPLLKVLKNKSS